MLQQILSDLYIDPDLLAELDEEQKQILFCKMREEQVRRWKEREDNLDRKEKKHPKKKKQARKNVKFLPGADGEPWTWVMGEHTQDKTIEQIMEDEAQKEAAKLAEKELEELRFRQEAELRAEEERLEKEKRQIEEKLKRKAQEMEIYQSAKQLQEAQKLENEKRREEERKKMLEEKKSSDENNEGDNENNGENNETNGENNENNGEVSPAVEKRHEMKRRTSVQEQEQNKLRRSSELYMTFKESIKLKQIEAEKDSKKLDKEWKEQEEKVKKLDAEKREIARRARADHKRSLKASTLAMTASMSLRDGKTTSLTEKENKPPIPSKPNFTNHSRRAMRPQDRESIIKWFKEEEVPKKSGLDAETGTVAKWFHGIISRPEAEQALQGKPVGSFLVRVSERVWGYAISYVAVDRCKHFLIDTSEGSYQFFGTNQISHPSLAELIKFHRSKPITSAGLEKLQYPMGQTTKPPDFSDLFDHAFETSYL